jgi:hypothetical protein
MFNGGDGMKQVFWVVTLLFILSGSVWAQSGAGQPTDKGQMTHDMMGRGMMGGDQQMPMRQHMTGGCMVMMDMMHMMKDMMRIQERMLTGASEADKKKMAQELSGMMERMDTMMSGMHNMQMGGMTQRGVPAPEKAE